MKKIATFVLLLITHSVTVKTCFGVNTSPIFEITTSQKVYAIGHPIDVIFETRNHPRSLSSLSLDVLNKNFVIHDYNFDKVEDIVDGKLVRIENLVVRMYPKRAGHLEIPVFKLGRYKSKPIFLDIINDFNSTIQIRTNSIKKTYYQREPINVYVDVFYRQKKILSSIGELKNKNFIISDVVKTEYTIRDNGINLPVDRFSWIVIPLLDGSQIIHLPMIKTGGRRMYPSGKLKINVAPLPSTLPVLVPVSEQTITDNHISNKKFLTDKVFYWSLSVLGNGLNEDMLDKILSSQLESDSNIRYFPRTYKRTRVNNGSQFKTDITIPFKLFKTGAFQFPILDIPFIDTETGILEHTYSTELSLSATSHLNETIKIVLALLLLVLIITQPLLRLFKRLYIKYRYRVCYYAILISTNPKRIKQLLFNLTPHYNFEPVLTIKSWQETAVTVNPEQRKTLNKISILLNNFNYGRRYSKNEIAVLKRLIKKLI